MENKEKETQTIAPIKRIDALKPLSRDHHHGLLLCWKIREGSRKQINPKRIKKYINHVWKNQLLPHFLLEEKYIFPILGNEHPLVKKAISQHRRLQRFFEDQTDYIKSISLIEEELELHIRFEERVLFNEIQLCGSAEQFIAIEKLHDKTVNEICWKDEFWK